LAAVACLETFAAESMDLTPLQSRVAREIVTHARRENLKAGQRLAESLLAEQIGTSRSPVNAALRHLATLGVLSHDLNRGYFLNRDAHLLQDLAQRFASEPDDPLYLQIAADRLDRRLPDTVNEADLVRLYGVSRGAVRKVLSRVQQEGWIEKAAGHGWAFQPMIDSAEAYEESYVFRAAVEPTALTGGRFHAEPAQLATLRRQQEFIAASGFETMTEVELFESNSEWQPLHPAVGAAHRPTAAPGRVPPDEHGTRPAPRGRDRASGRARCHRIERPAEGRHVAACAPGTRPPRQGVRHAEACCAALKRQPRLSAFFWLQLHF
jgi:DNA-binding GntR family transcriptional regulator